MEESYLSAQLRASAPYLSDAGWHETATLLLLAADEIEHLKSQVLLLKGAPQTHPRPGAVFS